MKGKIEAQGTYEKILGSNFTALQKEENRDYDDPEDNEQDEKLTKKDNVLSEEMNAKREVKPNNNQGKH